MKNIARIFLLLAVAGLIVTAIQAGLLHQLTFENLKVHQNEIQVWTQAHFLRAAVIYLLVYIFTATLALPGAAILSLAGGAVFGFVAGSILVSFASTIGATLCFLASRFLFRDHIASRFRSAYENVQQGVEKEGAFYLFTLRLIPAVPFFVINLVFGLTRMRTLTFFLVSQAGMIPGTLAFVNAGTRLREIHSPADILSLPVVLSFAVLGLIPWLAKSGVEAWKRRRLYGRVKRPKVFDYDILVIGAGAAGLVSAYVAAALKAKVGLIEKHRMGGDCLYTGCVPSKSLIRSASVAHLFRRGAEFGMQSVTPEVNFARVLGRVQDVIQKIEPHDSVERYTGLGVDCIKGTAKIEDPYRVRVGDRVMSTRNIIIATGASPVVPPIPGLNQVRYYTSETLWQMVNAPKRLLILGGGAIGCELAQAFARLGCATTVVERGGRLLPKEDEEVSEFLADAFRSDGIQVLTGREVVRFEPRGREGDRDGVDGAAPGAAARVGAAMFDNGEQVEFDAVMVALGRRANTRGFGLENLGIGTRGNGTLDVDVYLRTQFPNILACGDVAGPFQFTHAASHQAGYAVLNALFAPLKRFRVDYSSLPWCTYTDPEVARIGLNESEAQVRHVEYDVHIYEISHLDRAICDGENRGFVKVLTLKGKSRILGVTIAGPHAGELIAEFALAMRKKMGLGDIMNTVHAYPTYAEANRFVAGVWKRKTAPPSALRWLERFHRWRRGGARP
ncbi:MAG: FAD-dependent oxidoreductase [Bdellovibrionales bacterium]